MRRVLFRAMVVLTARNLHGRVSAIEASLDYLATKEDVKDIKIWALAGMVLAAAPSIGILRLFSQGLDNTVFPRISAQDAPRS